MRGPQVGDIVVYSNGLKLRIVGNTDANGNREILLVGINDWEAYVKLPQLETVRDLLFHPEIALEQLIPGNKLQTVMTL